MLTPKQCCFLFCLPLSQAEFDSDNANSVKHFVREHLPLNKPTENKANELWEVYQNEVVKPYEKFKQQFSKFGFHFIESVTFDVFKNQLDKHTVLIIFSHCKTGKDEAIEFYDRLVKSNEFIAAIPLNYDKVLDLSVCNPTFTASELKTKRKMMVVKSSSKSISFIYWLYFYSITFEIIYKNKVNYYSNALEQTISKLFAK